MRGRRGKKGERPIERLLENCATFSCHEVSRVKRNLAVRRIRNGELGEERYLRFSGGW